MGLSSRWVARKPHGRVVCPSISYLGGIIEVKKTFLLYGMENLAKPNSVYNWGSPPLALFFAHPMLEGVSGPEVRRLLTGPVYWGMV